MPTIEQRFAQAFQLHQSGRLAEAETLYRGILHESPKHSESLHLLGVLASQTGHYPAAEELIRQALAISGPNSVYLSNLASVYLSLGRLEETAKQARASLQLNPNNSSAHKHLGAALRRQGRLSEAEAAYRQAIQIKPTDGDAWYSLGAILDRQGKLQEAKTHLQEAIRLSPNNAQAHNDLGSVFLALGDYDPAAVHLREAIRLKPDLPYAHTNLGLTYRDPHEIGEAERCFREAVRLDPKSVVCRNNLADNLKLQCRIGEAVAEYRESLRLEPRNVIALAGLSKLAAEGYRDLTTEEAKAVGEVAVDQRLSADDRSRMFFALAATCDRAGHYADAFEYCRRANDLRREIDRCAGIVYEPATFASLIDRLIVSFSPQYFARVRGFGTNSDLPIFVLGVMRSGTTLVEQILASHPQVYGAGELYDMARLIGGLSARLQTKMEFPECVSLLDQATAQAVAGEYIQSLRELSRDAVRVVDKMPTNYFWLGLIATMFPKARIIHCRRDPADTCLSCYFQDFASPHPYTSDLQHMGHYYRQYERLMAHWSMVLPMQVFELRYEDLTNDQEIVSRRLVEFCGLSWDDRCLRFNENKRVVRTASSLQVRRPMYTSSVGRWKQYEPFLGPLLDELRLSGVIRG